jgi:hypothetical protein
MTHIPPAQRIESLGRFRVLIREIQDAIEGGLLIQSFRPGLFNAAGPAIGDLESNGPWPDIIDMHFVEPDGVQRYHLFVEVYRGAGGSWRLIGENV